MSAVRILVADEDTAALRACTRCLEGLKGVACVATTDPERALQQLLAEPFDLLIADLHLPEPGGLRLLELAKRRHASLPVLLTTRTPSLETAIRALQLGACDYLIKPVAPARMQASVTRVLGRSQRERSSARRALEQSLVGHSPAMHAVLDAVMRIADTAVDVLIVGETGTGKELVARSIHEHSRRRQGRFVPIDCAVIPENLIASELFGHERGAFTGADARSVGLLELAHGGTVFLDEILSLPLSMQAKFLRTLQERRIRRVGGKEEIPVDVRVIAAANRSPVEEVRAGRFREDLYYRINVGRIELPPLRERGDDVRLLAEHYLHAFSAEMGRPVSQLSEDAIEALRRYGWPGNVRELQNVIKQSLLVCEGPRLSVGDLPEEIREPEAAHPPDTSFFTLREQHLATFERRYLTGLLRAYEGDVSRCAREAHIPRGTFYRLLKKHKLNAADFRALFTSRNS